MKVSTLISVAQYFIKYTVYKHSSTVSVRSITNRGNLWNISIWWYTHDRAHCINLTWTENSLILCYIQHGSYRNIKVWKSRIQ